VISASQVAGIIDASHWHVAKMISFEGTPGTGPGPTLFQDDYLLPSNVCRGLGVLFHPVPWSRSLRPDLLHRSCPAPAQPGSFSLLCPAWVQPPHALSVLWGTPDCWWHKNFSGQVAVPVPRFLVHPSLVTCLLDVQTPIASLQGSAWVPPITSCLDV
jgi:hypothetical protein